MSTPAQIDAKLALKAQKGSEEAFKELLARHQETINILIAKRVFDTRLHEDMRQEAILAFVRAVSSFKPDENASFERYCSVVIDNALISLARKTSGKGFEFISEDVAPELASHINVEHEATQNIRDKELKTFMKQEFSSAEQEAYLLHLEGFSNIEIAQKLGIEVRSAANALDRARRKLKNF